jgi:hypothetical protein
VPVMMLDKFCDLIVHSLMLKRIKFGPRLSNLGGSARNKRLDDTPIFTYYQWRGQARADPAC